MLNQSIVTTDLGHNLQSNDALTKASCEKCTSNNQCLMKTIIKADEQQIGKSSNNTAVEQPRPLHKNAHLYRQGDEFKYLYIVRSGAVKSVRSFGSGTEQTTGFYLPGQILGFDAIARGQHNTSAICLGTSSVCRIPKKSLQGLISKHPEFRHHFMRLMSEEIIKEQLMLASMSHCAAEERLAILLIDLSEKYSSQQLSATQFALPMTRAEISNYLGLSPETISRLFKKFQDLGWITTEKRNIQLINLPELKACANRNIDTIH